MRQTLLAGTTYFAGIFALGFLLGTLRVLVFSALLDETILVLIEVPIILCASWVFCSYLIAKLPVAPRIADRILMGGAALAVLLTAEIATSVFGFDRTISDHLAHYATPASQIGLFGQLLFATFPLVQLQLPETPKSAR